MAPSYLPGYPGGHRSDSHRMRFGGISESIDVGLLKPKT
jgi:hypothetical protein